ncbi:MAG: response regulator [Clostridiaceae bacterium]|jgi:two-component system response regulator YesN|nr:response regulator [Clostridiaceae bacterium]
MLKVMIVDDEYYFREALKISLSWQDLGFIVCGEAKNGKEALDMIDDLEPDIILVDINMPIMDGLEFVNELKNRGADCKIVILTGHSEFQYAKEAVKLGVYNYILKPVNEKELTETLIDIKRDIETEVNIKIEHNRLKQQVKESIPLLKEKFLNELIQGNLPRNKNAITKRMEYLNIHFCSEYYRVITIEINDESSGILNDEDKQLWKFAVSNISCELLEEYFPYEMCYDSFDRICIIVGVKKNNQELRLLLESRLELIRTAVSKHLGFTVTIGVGNEKKSLHDISASYKEALVALKNMLTQGKDKVITYYSVEDSEIKINLFTAVDRNQLLIHLRTGDSKEIMNLLNQIFTEISSEDLHHEILYVICVEMAAVCMEYIIELGLPLKEVLPNNLLNIIEEIQSKRSIQEIREYMERIFKNTLEAASRSRSSKASVIVEGVKKYIHEHYDNSDMNIDEIARNLYVNYSHLCFIFKRDTGITINEYLTEYRMIKAKELFDAGNNLVLDVAAKVGYADANYFGKCFKKHYGLSPSKYIESIRR